MKQGRTYPARRGTSAPPDYRRTVAALSLSDLAHELETGRGSPAFLAAVSAEVDRRRIPRKEL